MPSALPDSLLKKGTGSELMLDHAIEKRPRRGACTLFQQAPNGRASDHRLGVPRFFICV
jgi:hypothetical protein